MLFSECLAWVCRANGLLVEFAEVLRAVFHGPVQRACHRVCRANGLLVEFAEVLCAVFHRPHVATLLSCKLRTCPTRHTHAILSPFNHIFIGYLVHRVESFELDLPETPKRFTSVLTCQHATAWIRRVVSFGRVLPDLPTRSIKL